MSYLRAVVIEDDLNIQKLLETCLRRAGYTALVSSAYEPVRDQLASFAPSVVILDYMLPGANAAEIIGEAPFGDASVILVSARKFSDTMLAKIRDAGVLHILSKPFGMQEFLACVRSAQRIFEVEKAASDTVELGEAVLDYLRRAGENRS